MPSQDNWKFTPVSDRTLAVWGRCPALTLIFQLITPSRASGTAAHVRSFDDLLLFLPLSQIVESFPIHETRATRFSNLGPTFPCVVIVSQPEFTDRAIVETRDTWESCYRPTDQPESD